MEMAIHQIESPQDIWQPNGLASASLITHKSQIDPSVKEDNKQLPPGWPHSIDSPMTWSGQDLQATEYIYFLSPKEKAEIHSAVVQFKELGLDGEAVSRENFPLPTLSERLRNARVSMYEGRGLFVLRGINPEEYSAEDSTIVYLGISSYIAEKRGIQDVKGNVLFHLIDTKSPSGIRPTYPSRNSNSMLPFHSDCASDIVALLVRGCAASRGDSLLASANKVYNELVEHYPDVVRTLAESNWPSDTTYANLSHEHRSLLYYHDGRIILNFSGVLMKAHARRQQNHGVSLLTPPQVDALQVVFAIAAKNQLKINLHPGDIQFINNLGLLHAREGFENDGLGQRHLVRLWLSDNDPMWSLPPALEIVRHDIFDNEEIEENWEIEPVAMTWAPLARGGSH